MSAAAQIEIWRLVGLGVLALGAGMVFCHFWLKRQREGINGRWEDIYFQLRERCRLVGELSLHLRKLTQANPRLVNDIEYLLRRMEVTNDPHTHAAVQNGLVLTVQTAVEQFHRSPAFQSDRDITRSMEAIGKLDSRLAPLRDRFNRSVDSYNRRLNTAPFSVAATLTRAEERSRFLMLIPWWSTDPAAYGDITAAEIRQQLQTWKAPLILAPSQRGQWPGGPPVVHVTIRRRPLESPGGTHPSLADECGRRDRKQS